MRLVFATNNQHKIKEVAHLLPTDLQLISLKDIECDDDLPETGVKLEDNARQKARYVHDKFGVDCFADDTGLEIEALNGRPGVYSARYAGPACIAEDNVLKVLTELQGVQNRKARFRTVIALYLSDKEYIFEGSIEGRITEAPVGSHGFGYDPVFVPEGEQRTFAEMSLEDKNRFSHRSNAIRKLSDFLKQHSIV